MDYNQIHTYFQEQKAWTEDFLKSLLEIPSESGDEQNAQDYLYKRLDELDAHCKLVPISNDIKQHPDYADPVKGLDYQGRCNILLEKKGTGGKVIVLNSHFDVVPPSPGQDVPYTPTLGADGKIYARGACDAKGQIAAMVLLVKAACELSPLKHTILCHMVVEEEFGGNGTLAMLEACKGLQADALINMEPTNLQPQTSIRGAVWFDMRFSGTAGHAGSAGNTQSAIYKAIAAIELLKKYHADLLMRSKDYGLFADIDNPMPLTIGEFQAGVWPAMVPSSARFRGVLGFLPNTNKDAVMQEIRELLTRPENAWISEGMRLNFCYRHNAVEIPPEHWLAEGIAAACTCCGISGDFGAMTASSDAVFYQERGIPSMAFGPGRISDAHSCHECIAVEDILKAAEILYAFFVDL